jgi:hypothetical protein
MPEPVIGIAREVQPLLHDETDRHAGIGVGTTQHEHEAVKRDQQQREVREPVPPEHDQYGQDDQDGRDLHPPCRSIGWRPARRQQADGPDDGE